MTKTPEPEPTVAEPAPEPDEGGGMKVPEGMSALSRAVPSSIPPEMFEEAPPSAPVVVLAPPPPPPLPARAAPMKPASIPRMAAVKPASVPGMPAVKPASVPRMAAVKPASVPGMPAVKPPSVPRMPAVQVGGAASDPHGTVTVQMPVAKMPPEAIASVPPPAATEAAAAVPALEHPSSFPSSGKMLVFDVTAPTGPALPSPLPPPSSLGPVALSHERPSSSAIVVTPEHEWLAAQTAGDDAGDRDELTDISSRHRETLLSVDRRKSPWARALSVLAAGAIAGAVLSFVLARTPSAHPSAPPPPTAAAAPLPSPVAAPVPPPEPTQAAAPSAIAEPPPVPASASAPAPAPVATAAPSDDKGRLSTAGSSPGRRIFVDDRTVGETPNDVVVPCGSHRVRVGSRGTTIVVVVPCGGEISVSDR